MLEEATVRTHGRNSMAMYTFSLREKKASSTESQKSFPVCRVFGGSEKFFAGIVCNPL
jgi:hypothetical protein